MGEQRLPAASACSLLTPRRPRREADRRTGRRRGGAAPDLVPQLLEVGLAVAVQVVERLVVVVVAGEKPRADRLGLRQPEERGRIAEVEVGGQLQATELCEHTADDDFGVVGAQTVV